MASKNKKDSSRSKKVKLPLPRPRAARADGQQKLVAEVTMLIGMVDELFRRNVRNNDRLEELEKRFQFVAYPWTNVRFKDHSSHRY
jgi:hypothetical protein